MLIPRTIASEVHALAREFPIVAILGARQSGKTTLSKLCFPEYQYVTLEDPDERNFASTDPRGFLNRYPRHVIFDEAQRCPDLFSYLHGRVDQQKEMGSFILTGSHNYLLNEKISQSLAGRVGIAVVTPFSFAEINHFNDTYSVNELMFRGHYPPVYDRNIRPVAFYANYVNTYLERDVRSISDITDYSRFVKFLQLLAGRTGQLLNKNELAVETGISHTTVEKWISVLETAFLVFRLQPWYVNFNKRLVKQPKVYFYDTGLVLYLLGIRNEKEIATMYLRGHLFENLIISELVKTNLNYGLNYRFWFWRDNHKNEIDLLIETGSKTLGIEIKSGETFRNEFLKPLIFWKALSQSRANHLYLIYGGNKNLIFNDMYIEGWKNSFRILLP